MGGNQPGTQSTRSHSKSDRIRILGSGNVWGEVIRVGGVLTSGQLCALHHAAASFCQDFADTSKQPGFCRCKQATNPSLSFYRSGHFWASRPIIVTASHITSQSRQGTRFASYTMCANVRKTTSGTRRKAATPTCSTQHMMSGQDWL